MNPFGVSDDELELMKEHLSLVIEANKKTNLTRIDSFEEGMLLHVEDSLCGLPEMNDAPKGRYADLGTGAGFPGIPLAIATGRNTTLVDTRYKKTAVLDEIINELDLADQISTETNRIELFAEEEAKAFSVVTARALAKLSVLMELASPLLQKHGRLICYKANVDTGEFNHAKTLESKLGMRLVSDRKFLLSDDETNRRIICFEKIGNPKIKLPRHVGFAQKKPL